VNTKRSSYFIEDILELTAIDSTRDNKQRHPRVSGTATNDPTRSLAAVDMSLVAGNKDDSGEDDCSDIIDVVHD